MDGTPVQPMDDVPMPPMDGAPMPPMDGAPMRTLLRTPVSVTLLLFLLATLAMVGGFGIIDLRPLPLDLDGITLIAGLPSWTAGDQSGMAAWCMADLSWSRTSLNGVQEKNTTNNHGAWYDMHVQSLAMFVQYVKLARAVAGEARPRRLAAQNVKVRFQGNASPGGVCCACVTEGEYRVVRARCC
jgi:hypothetical protein